MATRPSTRRSDGEMTRARILEAAGALFAENGYSETSGKAIAARARVDLASINYHFGNRDELYQTALVEAHRRVFQIAELQELAKRKIPAATKLEWIVDKLLVSATMTPNWHVRVLAREILAPTSHFQVLAGEALPKFAVIRDIFSEITGIPVGDPAVLRCVISSLAPCTMLLLVGGSGAPGPARDTLQTSRDDLTKHLVRFAIAGLEAIRRDYSARGTRTANITKPRLSQKS
jgi:AcrR family transcriptional regulator